MKLVRAVLRDHLDLRAAESAEFGVIRVRNNLHFLDGVRIGRDNSGRTPRHAGSLHAINGDAIGVVPPTIGKDLWLVLGHIRTSAGSGADILVVAGQGRGTTACILRT